MLLSTFLEAPQVVASLRAAAPRMLDTLEHAMVDDDAAPLLASSASSAASAASAPPSLSRTPSALNRAYRDPFVLAALLATLLNPLFSHAVEAAPLTRCASPAAPPTATAAAAAPPIAPAQNPHPQPAPTVPTRRCDPSPATPPASVIAPETATHQSFFSTVIPLSSRALKLPSLRRPTIRQPHLASLPDLA